MCFRRGHDVLTATLPRKVEYTLLIRMSPVQRRLYTEFMGQVNIGDSGWVSTNPLKAFAVCCKVTPYTCHVSYLSCDICVIPIMSHTC